MISNYASANETGDDVNAVVALDSAGINDVADLAGKRVAVNSLGAAGDVTIRRAVEDAGGDPSTIEWVEVGFPDAQAQLEANNIDAAWVPDPFMSRVAGGDGHIVVHPYQATIPGLSLLTNIALSSTDPELVASFNAAMEETLAFATDNEPAVRAAIASNLQIPPEAADGITLPRWIFELDRAQLEELVDLAVDYEVLPE